MARFVPKGESMAAVQRSSAKFQLVRALRATGLLRLADSCKFVMGQARTWSSNRRFRERHPGFPTPPRHLAYDALNHVDWERYRQSGLGHGAMFARTIREGTPPGAPLRILEWGCGPGRLIRHMASLLADREVALTGSDYNAESVAWCRANLPGIAFVENGLNPPLPFDAGQFDVVYNFSVLTHLSETVQLAWIEELRRVLKPGGLLVCTTHGEAYRYLLAAPEEQASYEAGRLVEQGRYREGRKWFLAIHPPAFVQGRLLAGWDDVRRIQPLPEDGMLQDVWVARKPANPALTPSRTP